MLAFHSHVLCCKLRHTAPRVIGADMKDYTVVSYRALPNDRRSPWGTLLYQLISFSILLGRRDRLVRCHADTIVGTGHSVRLVIRNENNLGKLILTKCAVFANYTSLFPFLTPCDQ